MDGQQAHVKILHITNHQGNENQNYNDISLHTSQDGHFPKGNAGMDAEKREPSYTVGGNVNWFNCCGKQYGGSSKI